PGKVPNDKRSAMARMPSPDFHWRVPGAVPNARHAFGMTTCNGCHAGETATTFMHISPRQAGSRSVLSAFLSKRHVMLPDPVDGTKREFDVPGARMQKLNDLLCE